MLGYIKLANEWTYNIETVNRWRVHRGVQRHVDARVQLL